MKDTDVDMYNIITWSVIVGMALGCIFR